MMNHLDLFSGIGGFALGLQRTGGFKTIGFCDFDAKTHPVLKKNFPGVPIYDDVRTLKGADIGTVDIVTGGFPCQDLSVAGKGAGLKGERSGLWYEMHRIIKETRPKWVIAENVAVLRSRGLDEVLGSLAEIGYDAEWHCIPACSVGAPHRRDRIWIVAYPNGSVATNGGQCQDSQGEGNSRGTEQGRSGSDDRQGCIRSSGSSAEDAMAYASKLLCDGSNDNSRISMESEKKSKSRNSCGKEDVAYTSSQGLEGQRSRTSSADQKQSMLTSSSCVVRSLTYSTVWETEPSVGRVADGVPNRVDRLKQLGNALVPQIVTIIGSAILEAEQT
jgi:DNA (cytosine-5)-methyltransferase 1